MSKNNENKLVPKLRFPKYSKDGEWEKKTLDEVGSVIASGDLDEKTFSPIKTETHIYPIYSNSVSQEGIYGYSSTFKYKSESVTITARGTLGVAFERKTNFVGIGRLLVVSDLKDTHPNFLKENWNHQAKIPLENGGIPQLTAVKAKSISLFFPKKNEQQKIAACLSSLDEVITDESQKLEVLKEHKKGLLQNLFPQEGETMPKLRFKEFENSGEWRSEGVGNLFKFKQGVQVPVENQFANQIEGMVRFIRIIDITNNSEPYRYIESPSSEHLIETNDLFMIRYGTPGLISIGYEGVIANNLFRLIWKYDELFVPRFWLYAFQKIEKLIYELSSSSSMPAISFSTMEGVSLLFPKNPSEQQKIADTLLSSDDLINAQIQKLEALQLHKKGLLQGLFPSINNEE